MLNTKGGPFSELGDDFIVKPYCLLTGSITADNTLDVNLVDSKGTLLQCNYVEVVNIAGNGKANNFNVEVSSFGSFATNNKNYDPAGASALPGITSYQRRANSASIVCFFLPDSAKISSLRILPEATSEFAVNYGVAVPYNPMRSKDRPTGS